MGFFHLFRNLFFEHFWTTFFVVLLIYLLQLRYKNNAFIKAINKLPGHKAVGAVYGITGHLYLILPHRLRKSNVSNHVYDFEAIDGFNVLSNAVESGISNIWQFYNPIVLTFKANTVETLLNNSKELKKAWVYNFLHPWLGMGLLTSFDEKWRNRRKVLTPAFHFNILKDFQFVFNKQSKILCDVLRKHAKEEYVDILPFITRCSLDIICESILGKEIHTQTEGEDNPYFQYVHTLTNLTFERLVRPWLWIESLYFLFPSGRMFFNNTKFLHKFTSDVISEKKKAKLTKRKSYPSINENGSDDIRRRKRALLDLLLDEHIENNSISEEEIREEVDTFTFEGHDTTALSMSWTTWLIGLHPWVQDKIHAELDEIFGEDQRDVTVDDLKEMKYLECVIKESLRLYPSVVAFGRETREDLEFPGGHIVPAGSTCAVVTYRLHRDPEVFPNPEKFDPERFTPENSAGRHAFAYVPFSAGPRNCIGQRFALMEEKTVLSSILRRYKLRSLDPRDKVSPSMELLLRPEGELRVQVRERNDKFDFHKVYYNP